MTNYLKKLLLGNDLSSAEAFEAMNEIMSGRADQMQTAGLLMALAMKGETGEEIEAFARAMRAAAVAWPNAGASAATAIIDTCGTGGDSASILNISTIAAVVLSSFGNDMKFQVAKHGNRAVSSPTGSADVLEHLGIQIDVSHEAAASILNQVNICFLFAQSWHPAMRFAAPVRRALGVRTIFNILGPITNPAPLTHQLMGVFDRRFLVPVAKALAGLGRKHAFVIHSRDGLDEVSIAAATDYVEIQDGHVVKEGTWQPADFGIATTPIDSLRVSDRQESADRFERILKGEGTDIENRMVSVNAGVVLTLLQDNLSLLDARQMVVERLQSGAAFNSLQKWKSVQHTSSNDTESKANITSLRT